MEPIIEAALRDAAANAFAIDADVVMLPEFSDAVAAVKVENGEVESASLVRDCIKRAKVTPITLKGLRDTHASLCRKVGVPIEVISQRLGHASIGVTVERYMHVYSDRDAEAADAFGRLVG